MEMPKDPGEAGLWTKQQRETRGWSAKDLARRLIIYCAHIRGERLDLIVAHQPTYRYAPHYAG